MRTCYVIVGNSIFSDFVFGGGRGNDVPTWVFLAPQDVSLSRPMMPVPFTKCNEVGILGTGASNCALAVINHIPRRGSLEILSIKLRPGKHAPATRECPPSTPCPKTK